MSKKVLCTECGFLGWIDDFEKNDWAQRPVAVKNISIGPKQREFIQSEVLDGFTTMFKIHCYRVCWILVKQGEQNIDFNKLAVSTIIKSRQCPYYIRYRLGYSPAEHKEILNRRETHRAMWVSAAIGAAIGGSIAIAAQIIYPLLTPP